MDMEIPFCIIVLNVKKVNFSLKILQIASLEIMLLIMAFILTQAAKLFSNVIELVRNAKKAMKIIILIVFNAILKKIIIKYMNQNQIVLIMKQYMMDTI